MKSIYLIKLFAKKLLTILQFLHCVGAKNKILITGGTGFIGRNLVEYLSDRYEVTAPTHDELDLMGGASVKSFFHKKKFDVVIHAASKGSSRKQRNDSDILSINLKMFLNLLSNESCFEKLIFFGSGAEYGKQRPLVKVKETEFGYVPEDDYGLSKYICSKVSTEKCINLRLFGVFGKYEDYETRFISNMICRAIKGQPMEMNQNMFLDYVYIEDLCRIVELIMKTKAKNRAYNISSGDHIDLKSIAEIIINLSKKAVKLHIAKPGMNREYTCDSNLFRTEFPEFKFTKMETAIKDLYDWYIGQEIKEDNLRTYK